MKKRFMQALVIMGFVALTSGIGAPSLVRNSEAPSAE